MPRSCQLRGFVLHVQLLVVVVVVDPGRHRTRLVKLFVCAVGHVASLVVGSVCDVALVQLLLSDAAARAGQRDVEFAHEHLGLFGQLGLDALRRRVVALDVAAVRAVDARRRERVRLLRVLVDVERQLEPVARVARHVVSLSADKLLIVRLVCVDGGLELELSVALSFVSALDAATC